MEALTQSPLEQIKAPTLPLAEILERATAAEFTVVGDPIPQGSMKSMHHRASGQIVSMPDNPKTRPWKNTVTAAAIEARQFTATEPVVVQLSFAIRRPNGHYGSGRNAGVLRSSAPTYPGKKPDLDKLVRAVLDSLVEAKVILDDALVTGIRATKWFADTVETGVSVRVWVA
jgi:Holliday junction resolvase RusA-like endonuclease